MAKAQKRSPKRTELNWWTRSIFSPKSDGTLCRRLKPPRNIGPAAQAKRFSLPIKIDTEPWALSRWTRMEIWPQQPQLAATQINDQGAWAIRQSLGQEPMPTMRHALSPRRATASISFGLQSAMIFRH